MSFFRIWNAIWKLAVEIFTSTTTERKRGMRKDQWFDNSIKMLFEGSRIYGDRSTYRFVNESLKFFYPLTRSSSRHTRPQIYKNSNQTAAATWTNFCCPPLKMSLRSAAGLAYYSESWEITIARASTTSGWEGWNMKIKISDIRFQWEKVPFS